MTKLFNHYWEATDSQGHSLCCNHCGLEIFFTTEEYNEQVDAVCPQQIALLRAEEVLSSLSEEVIQLLSFEAIDSKRYAPTTNVLEFPNFELTKKHFELVQLEADNRLNVKMFFDIVNAVLIQKMKVTLVG